MIESPRITVVLALVKLSAGGIVGVEMVSSKTLIFPFPFSLGREVESFDLWYRSLERSLTTNLRDSRSSISPLLRSFSAINSRHRLSFSCRSLLITDSEGVYTKPGPGHGPGHGPPCGLPYGLPYGPPHFSLILPIRKKIITTHAHGDQAL